MKRSDNTISQSAFIKLNQLPSFGNIKEEDKPTDLNKQRSLSHFQQETFRQKVDRIMDVNEKEDRKMERLWTLNQLKKEAKQKFEYRPLDHLSIDSSFHESYTREDSRPTTKEVLLTGQKKNLEVELSNKMRQIQKHLLKQRELQNQIHHLRLELSSKVESQIYEEINRKYERNEYQVRKLENQLRNLIQQRDRLIAQNSGMRRQLLRRQFQVKLFKQDDGPKNEQIISNLQKKCEDLQKSLEESKARLRQHEQQFAQKKAQVVKDMQKAHSEKSKELAEHLKADLTKLDVVKKKLLKEAKNARAAYQTFDLQIDYEQIFGGILAKLQHGVIQPTNSYDHLINHRVEPRSHDSRNLLNLEQQLNSLKQHVKKQNQVKKLFLKDVQTTKFQLTQAQKEKNSLLQQMEYQKVLISEYQKIAQSNKYFQKRVKELEQNIQNKPAVREEETSTFQKQDQDTIQKLQKLQSDYYNLKLAYQQLGETHQQLQKTHQQLQMTHNNLVSDHQQLQQSHNNIQSTYQQQLQSNQQYIQQLESALIPQQPRLPTIFKKSSQNERLFEENSQLQHKLLIVEHQVQQLKNNLQIAITTLEQQNQQLKQKLQMTANKHSQAQQQINLLKQHNDRLSNQVKTLQNDKIKQITPRQSKHEPQIASDRQLNTLKHQIESLQNINKTLTSKSHASMTMIDKYQQEIKNFKSQLGTTTSQLSAATAQLAAANNQLTLQSNKFRNLQQFMKQQQQTLNQVTIKCRQLEKQVKEKSVAIDHLWQVKLAEYEQVQQQLNKLKTVL